MAKLYWRVKRKGKWTWVPASMDNTNGIHFDIVFAEYVEEEE
jgi:hypothetical protein